MTKWSAGGLAPKSDLALWESYRALCVKWYKRNNWNSFERNTFCTGLQKYIRWWRYIGRIERRQTDGRAKANNDSNNLIAILLFFITLAPWRVLGIDKWARLRLAQTSTRRYKIIRIDGKRERSGVARWTAWANFRFFALSCFSVYIALLYFSVVMLFPYPPNIAFSGAQISIVPRISQRS